MPFMMRHNQHKIRRKDIRKAKEETFLGIDAGSTTTKATLIDSEKNLLYSFYRSNEGKSGGSDENDAERVIFTAT